MRKLIGVVVLAAALSPSQACRSVMVEPLRVDNMDAMTIRQLGFVKGRTTFAQAERMMKSHGLTGISKDVYVDDRNKLFQVVSADYQDKVHVFEDNRYKESVDIGCKGMLPYGFALRLAKTKGKVVLMALFRDALDLTDRLSVAGPPRIELFEREDGSFKSINTISLGRLSQRHGGLTSPLFVGHDLGLGVIFVARGRDGRVWERAYMISMKQGEIRVLGMPLEEAARCSCVRNYIYGGAPLSPKDI
jgi:hypothetical protein